MTADRRSQIAKGSAISCDHMETHFCDRLRSYYDRDLRRSQTIAEDRTRIVHISQLLNAVCLLFLQDL